MRSFFIYIPMLLMHVMHLNAACSSPECVLLEQKVVDALKNSWCSEQKARLIFEFVVSHRPAVCVEVGVFTGASALPLLTGLQYVGKGKAYMIDAWSCEDAVQGLPQQNPNTVWWAGLDMHAVKGQFIQMIDHWALRRYSKILHMNSKRAVTYLPSIDFLHLDGNFSEEGALLDTQLYLPKVVSGGHILISNVLTMIDQKPTKMKALWLLFEQCEIVSEIENGNAFLFKKK